MHYVGDSYSWVILCDTAGELCSCAYDYVHPQNRVTGFLTSSKTVRDYSDSIFGTAFEVLDYRCNMPVPDMFMRITDPYVVS